MREMSQSNGFYTMKGYALNADGELTSAMEDYLEMIARLTRQNASVRVSDLSGMLHVKASSATKMVQQLGLCGFIQAEKYSDIHLTDKGRDAGNYLLYRHEVIHRFLCVLNHSENELEQAEKIEHFLDRATVKNLELLTERLMKK
jgi:Mn-dependent DtxR family transcriptional regulator